ncbi:MAG: hypothetical protein ACE5IO_06270, partial [Thermoplasmata archaeon]
MQPPIIHSPTTMDDFLSPLEVTTDKYFYEVGEIIHITLTNVGLGPIEFMYYPWDQIIEDSDGNVVVDTRLCWLRLTVITPLPPGANESDVWGQRYLICEDFDEVPPSGEQVPSGKYEISVGLDDATYGGVYMPVWGSTWIEIGPADNPPVADAGPDQTVSVGDTVFFNGSGSHASVGEVIPLGDNFMINELRGLGGVGGVPQAVFDSDGNLHITWTDSTHKGGIYFDKAPYQGAFGTDVKVGDLFSTWSDIALGPNGDIHIAWWLGDIQYSVSTDGGLTFSSPIAISEANTPGGYPVRISTGPNGSVHVVWASISPSRICYRSSSDGGKKWDSGVVIAEGGFPDIAVSEDGSVYVTWQGLAEGSANASILFSRKSPDGVFEPKITVHPLGSFRHINPSIALGPNGEVLIAWMEYSDGEYRIAFARSVDGGLSFGTPIIVRAVKPDANPGIMRLVETAVTAFGSRGVAVAWIEYLEPFTQVAETRVSVSLNVGRTFSPYSRVDDFAEAGKRQAVIVGNAQGDFFAAWHDGRDCPSKGL